MSRPKLVGVTGGIGSGKTTVCKVFEVLGAKTYNADSRAKSLMESNRSLVEKIKDIFGVQAYQSGKLNRKEIARQAFDDKSLLTKLNVAVHPAVKSDFEQWVQQNSSEKILLKEAALLIETGSYKELDHLIVVLADERTKLDRVVKRDQRDEEEVMKIISKQLPDSEKIPLADFIIHNDGSNSVIKQAMDIYNQL